MEKTWGWMKAKLCVGRCNALREIGNVGTEIVSPILDKRISPILYKKNGGKTRHTSHCSPQEISAEPEYNLCA